MALGRQLGRGILWFERTLLVEGSVLAFGLALATDALVTRNWVRPLSALGLVVLLASRLWRLLLRYRPQHQDRPGERRDLLQLELILLCAVYLLLHLSGAAHSPAYPLLYVLLAAVGGFDASLVNRLVVVGVAGAFEVLSILPQGSADMQTLAVHLGAIAGFPFLVGAMEWAWTASERKRFEAMVRKRLAEADTAAREYRLSGMVTSANRDIPADKRRQDLQRSSIQQLGVSMQNILQILDRALKPHTVAIYWLAVDEKTVTLRDAISTSNVPLRKSMEAGEGIIAAIIRSRATVSHNHIRKHDRLYCYYQNQVAIRSFMGVPLFEKPDERAEQTNRPWHLRGVLLVDRRLEKVEVPFGDDEEKLLQVAATEIIRVWKTEQRLNRMDTIRNHAQGLYDATEGLIKAISLQEVIDEVLRSLRRIYPRADFAAAVLKEHHGRNLVIEAVDASDAFKSWTGDHLGRAIARGNHLCSLALKKGMILPDAAYDKRSRSQRKLFGDRQDPPGLKSVKVSPLKLISPEEENIGVVVVGGTSPALFHERGGMADEVNRTLETVSNIAAISIQNARRYEQLEEMATTDPLTGLHNRRKFFELMAEEFTKAERYERPLSLIMTDIDHFKRVNDTYGHPMGDEVLKRVARVLNELARSTDRVSRVGGEEFTVLMPETDPQGGLLLAERFRNAIREQEFTHEEKGFSVTLSLGICTYPDQARDAQDLFQRADQALYHAKNSGRDRTVLYDGCAPQPPRENPT